MPDEETSRPDGNEVLKEAVKTRLRGWAKQSEDESLRLVAQCALVLVDDAKETLRAAVPPNLALRLADDGREFTLGKFSTPGTVSLLADIVLEEVDTDESGRPVERLWSIERLTDSVATMLQSTGLRIRAREPNDLTGFTIERKALLAETAEVIAAQLTGARFSMPKRDTLSAANVQSAAVTLEEHFTTLRNSQSKTAAILVLISAAIVAVATFIGALPIWFPSLLLPESVPSWYASLHFTTILLPIYGLAGFLVRESTKHRNVAIWATRLAAQLQSIGPFVGSFKGSYPSENADDTRDLWMSFGRDNVFAPERNSERSGASNSDINEVVKSIADIAGSAAKGVSS